MHIQEFQAKEMLAGYGIRVPAGAVAASADEARQAGERLGGAKWMVKAQICAGGRGRGRLIGNGNGNGDGGRGADGQSGIRTADTPDEIHAHAGAMLGNALVTAQTGTEGLAVERVYVEEALEVERELALSMLVDERNRRLSLLLFERGGVGIEGTEGTENTKGTATGDPASFHSVAVDLRDGADAGQLDAAVAKLGLDAALQSELKEISANIIRLFGEKDASLIEINPLAVCGTGGEASGEKQLVALDAKMTFDKNALFRQPDILAMEQEMAQEMERALHPNSNQSRRLAGVDGFNYIPLDGDVACLTVGAGLSMATLDAIRHYGGRPANFLDLPPDSKVNRVVSALEALLANPRATSLLVNVFGGGIMRCDTVADAILLVNHGKPIALPLTVRLCGTNSELANRRLRESMPAIFLAANLAEAAQVAAADGQGGAIGGGRGGPGGRRSLVSRCLSALGLRPHPGAA